jgi:hypothetical protein
LELPPWLVLLVPPATGANPNPLPYGFDDHDVSGVTPSDVENLSLSLPTELPMFFDDDD